MNIHLIKEFHGRNMMGEVDRYYLPNRWTKRFAPSEIIAKHFEIIKRANSNIRAKIPCTLNLPYGQMKKEKVNIFGTDLDERAPVIIFIHGGYWSDKTITRESYEFIAENFYKNEIKTIFVGYEVCPDVLLEEIVRQVDSAIKFCLEHARNSRGIYLMGHSSGAHLTASFFMDTFNDVPKNLQNLVKGVFLISGIYELEPLCKTVINSALSIDKNTAKLLSPYCHRIITGKDTAFYLFCAQNDAPGFQKQASLFQEKLEILGIPSKLEIIESVDHFDIIELFQDERYKLTQFVIDTVTERDVDFFM